MRIGLGDYIPHTLGDRLLVLGAAICFGLSLQYLVNDQPQLHAPDASFKVGLIESQGLFRRRHAGTLGWAQLKGQAELYLRDIVYTAPGTVAVVKMQDGRVVQLPPDSLIQFDEMTVRNLEVVLKDQIAEKKQRLTFQLIPLPVSTQLPDVVTSRELESTMGKLLAKRREIAGQQTEIKPIVAFNTESGLDKLTHFKIEAVTPVNNDTFRISTSDWLTLRWTPVPVNDIRYYIEISQTPTFLKRLTLVTYGNEIKMQVNNAGTYYWRITATQGRKQVVSGSNYFNVALRSDELREEVLSETDATQLPTNKFIYEISDRKDFSRLLEVNISDDNVCHPRSLKTGNYFCRTKLRGERIYANEYPFEVR